MEKSVEIERLGEGKFRVKFTRGQVQTVTATTGGLMCTCPDFRFRKRKVGEVCKHIEALTRWMNGQRKSKESEKNAEKAVEERKGGKGEDKEGAGGVTPSPLPEAPASVTVRARIEGFSTLITIRDTEGRRLMEKTLALVSWLKKHGFKPE